MIRYMPLRSTPSACLKEERVFESTHDMLTFVYEARRRFCSFVGSEPLRRDQIVLEDLHMDDPRISWKHIRKICVIQNNRPQCIGYCGE